MVVNKDEVYKNIDQIRESVDVRRKEPIFSKEMTLRNNRSNDILDNKDKLFYRAGEVMLYPGVFADRIKSLIESGVPRRVFQEWKVSIVAKMDADTWIKDNWKKTDDGKKMAVIWLPNKIKGIIGVAKIMNEPEWPIPLFKAVPHAFQKKEGIPLFWAKFDILWDKLRELGVPYYSSQTTLIHLLLDMGYPCLKPDIIVMSVAKELGIVVPHTYTDKKGKFVESYSDKNRRHTVTFFQEYCINRQIKPAVLDLYLLIHGGQSDAMQYVR
jgi:hypothetical protein